MTRLRNLSKSGAGNVIFQVLFLLAFYFLGREVSLTFGPPWKPLLLLLLVLIPCGLWATFFYLQDRNEPEPTFHVLVAFFAGMGIAGLVGLPLAQGLLQVGEWMYFTPTFLVIGSVFALGGIGAFLFYLVLRYGFYPLDEFDEPEDGMVYGAFVGSGFALVTSFAYLWAHPNYTLFAIAYTAATNVLVYATIGSLIGYFIGTAKFRQANIQGASLGAVLLGTVLLGGYNIANEFIFLEGFEGTLWLSFLLTVVFAAAVLSIAYVKMKRLEEQSQPQKVPVQRGFDVGVFALFLVFLVVTGIGKAKAMQGVEFASEAHGLSFRYSHAFSTLAAPDLAGMMSGLTLSKVASSPMLPFEETVFSAGLLDESEATVSVAVKPEVVDLSELKVASFIGSTEPLSLHLDEVEVAGKEGVRLTYSYVERSQAFRKAFPDVMWVYTDVVPANERTFVFSFRATSRSFQDKVEFYDHILQTVEFNE